MKTSNQIPVVRKIPDCCESGYHLWMDVSLNVFAAVCGVEAAFHPGAYMENWTYFDFGSNRTKLLNNIFEPKIKSVI